ncbi:MAG: hypothetical protein CL927_00765 [Deltaproteobacteria bacterium]|nr:hypothetical protein [Deltaproteobacteria bacterium]HCH61845.1 hypothetical protein [Deltaproteobacteria bacterium]
MLESEGGLVVYGLLLAFGAVFLTLLVVDTMRLGAPPMPSSARERLAVVALVERRAIELARPVRVLEAGAGWGGLALAIARAHPDFQVVAVEGAVFPLVVCAVRVLLHHLLGGAGLTVLPGDALRADYADVDVVVAFLGPETTAELAARLAQLSHPPQVISVGFAVRGWRQRARIQLRDRWRSEAGLWVFEPGP